MSIGRYIIKVLPMLDTASTQRMEATLSRRFSGVARKFGRGLSNATRLALTGGAIGAGFVALSAAVLNPLREADQKINDILAKADNIGTRSKQFGTTNADYFALQSVANNKGVSEGDLTNMLSRVQNLIGEAKLGKDNVLSNFKGETDMMQALLKIKDNLNNITDNEKRAAMENDIFGSKLSGKAAEFMSKYFDIAAASRDMMEKAGATRQQAENRSKELGSLEDAQALLKEITAIKDYLNNSKSVTREVVEAQNARTEKQNEITSANMKFYTDFSKVAISLQETQLEAIKKAAEALELAKKEQAIFHKVGENLHAAVEARNKARDTALAQYKEISLISTLVDKIASRTPPPRDFGGGR